jgi:hypothetical protein
MNLETLSIADLHAITQVLKKEIKTSMKLGLEKQAISISLRKQLIQDEIFKRMEAYGIDVYTMQAIRPEETGWSLNDI